MHHWGQQHNMSMGQRKNLRHDLSNTEWALHPLSYENSWRARSLNWVHMWQAFCILLGSALSKSLWVVISKIKIVNETLVNQHNTSVGQRKNLSPCRIWTLDLMKNLFCFFVVRRCLMPLPRTQIIKLYQRRTDQGGSTGEKDKELVQKTSQTMMGTSERDASKIIIKLTAVSEMYIIAGSRENYPVVSVIFPAVNVNTSSHSKRT